MAESTKEGSMEPVSHLLMVWVMEVCRCSTGLLPSLGREGTRVLSAGMLTLRRKVWRLVGCHTKQGGSQRVMLHKASQAVKHLGSNSTATQMAQS